MTPVAALVELIERVADGHGATIHISDHELSKWPDAAVAAMKSQKLIVRSRPSSSAICPGCERECVMPVHGLSDGTGSNETFIVCDKRSDINRVHVAQERLMQWRCGITDICRFVAESLAVRNTSRLSSNETSLFKVGVVVGKKRSQMVCLRTTNGLELVAGGNTLPLAELIVYLGAGYSIDVDSVCSLVDSADTADNRYTPSNARREARKLDTQTMYESWRRELRKLKKKHRNMSDVWYSRQIAKSEIARGRSAETIRKHMRK